MKTKSDLIILTAVLPYDAGDQLYQLLKKLNAEGYSVDLFSSIPPDPDIYSECSQFSSIVTSLDKACHDKQYSTAIFNGIDSVPVLFNKIKSIATLKTVLFKSTNDMDDEWLFDLKTANEEDVLELVASAETQEPKLTSIIMLTFNQLELTKQTLASLEQYTHAPYELVVVDNGSTDGTIAFLDEYKNKYKNVSCIYNEQNLGFAKANNQGIEISKGEYVLLLNNDVILTENWLSRLIACAQSFRSSGVVGPCTNKASGPQKTEPEYTKIEDLQKFASLFAVKNSGCWVDCHRLNAFCFLIKKEVIDAVGMLDEDFGPGGFEDYDYCLRVRQGGYRVLMAGDTYVHHIGGQGYEPNKLDYNELRVVNKEIFINKWCRRALEIMEIIPDG